MTKARTTAALLAAAFLVTAWWVIVERPLMFEQVYPGRLFPHLMRDDVTRIEIERPEGPIVVARGDGNRWSLEKPIAYPAATGAVDTMLSALVFLEAKVILEGGAEGAFPAAGPRLAVRFTAQDESYAVAIGNRHVAEPLEHYRVGAKLFLADETLKTYAGRSVFDWRDRSVCPVSPDHAGAVTVDGGGAKAVFTRSERGMWFVRQPFEARADANAVTALVDGANSLAAKEFLRDDGAGSLEPYGLALPRWKVTVAALDGRERYEIAIGGRAGTVEPPEIYVKRADLPTVFRCEDTVTEHLARDVADLRDRRVLPFAEYGWVKKIAVRGFGRDFSLVRAKEDGNWMLIDREAGEKQSEAPRDRGEVLADEIANLKIGASRPGETIGAEQFRFEVTVEKIEEPQALILGRELEENRFLARRKGVEGDDGIPFEVFTGLPARIRLFGKNLYEDPRRAVIPEDKLLAFELFSKQGHWLLVSFPEWKADGYESTPLDQTIVSGAVDTVRAPTAAFFEPNARGAAELGLDRTRARLRVRLPQGFGETPYRELFIGKQVDEPNPLSYAILDSNPAVFVIDPSALFNLADHLAEVCAVGEKKGEVEKGEKGEKGEDGGAK